MIEYYNHNIDSDNVSEYELDELDDESIIVYKANYKSKSQVNP